ncbi:MAG: type I methionyl aminopeptidase, partial [Bifidobacteriaceae bacterium]|nr:type I methionyl aminopeptidase [Bifidobacteriaceae bacterium]
MPALELKTPEQVAAMRRAGLVVAAALSQVQQAALPGVTGLQLDQIAEQVIRDHGAKPNFLGYNGYPASICLSPDDVIVHGIPNSQPLREGQIISVDCGAVLDGWHGDAAITFGIGEIDQAAEQLIEVTRQALWAGIRAMSPGNHVRDIGQAVETCVRQSAGHFGVIEDYTGHGIGRAMHMSPDVPNYATRTRGPKLRVGAVLAIEPMVVEQSIESLLEADGWTVRTADSGRAAHWEHTVALTEQGFSVL